MFYEGNFLMGGMHFLWWFFWVLLLGIIIYSYRRRANKEGKFHQVSPHEILQRHLASGEITPDQYKERKLLLDRDEANKK